MASFCVFKCDLIYEIQILARARDFFSKSNFILRSFLEMTEFYSVFSLVPQNISECSKKVSLISNFA